MTVWEWRDLPNNYAGTGDDFFRRIRFTHQPAEVVAGSERPGQTIQRFRAKRLEQFVRHQTHVLKHAGAMPADHSGIVGSGLADAKFLRHASGSSVAQVTLARKDSS